MEPGALKGSLVKEGERGELLLLLLLVVVVVDVELGWDNELH